MLLCLFLFSLFREKIAVVLLKVPNFQEICSSSWHYEPICVWTYNYEIINVTAYVFDL